MVNTIDKFVYMNVCMSYEVFTREYNRIDAFEGMSINKTDASKKCLICQYWYFKEFELHVCNDCHDILHCVKIDYIWSYSGQHFPAFRLNMKRYSLSLCMQSRCGKMRTMADKLKNIAILNVKGDD